MHPSLSNSVGSKEGYNLLFHASLFNRRCEPPCYCLCSTPLSAHCFFYSVVFTLNSTVHACFKSCEKPLYFFTFSNKFSFCIASSAAGKKRGKNALLADAAKVKLQVLLLFSLQVLPFIQFNYSHQVHKLSA